MSVPAHSRLVPADRGEAKRRNSSIGNVRSERIWRITPPTWPVAPTIPTRITFEVTDGRAARRGG